MRSSPTAPKESDFTARNSFTSIATTLPTRRGAIRNLSKSRGTGAPHPLIIRTFDLGGDKMARRHGDIGDELNPFLGWRAIRFCLENIRHFQNAAARHPARQRGRNVKIMFPMISGLEELRARARCARGMQERAGSRKASLRRRNGSRRDDRNPERGHHRPIVLAREVDFFSIGTNDLIQYALAVDRVNEKIAHLYEPTHPAVLRLLKMVADAAHANDIWVGVCGEMAGDLALIPLAARAWHGRVERRATLVPRVKRAVQSLAIPECRELVEEVART